MFNITAGPTDLVYYLYCWDLTTGFEQKVGIYFNCSPEFCNIDQQCLMHTCVHANAKQVISHKGVRMAEVCKALSDPAAPRQADLNMSDEMLLFGGASW